jgi:hypothetical protein
MKIKGWKIEQDDRNVRQYVHQKTGHEVIIAKEYIVQDSKNIYWLVYNNGKGDRSLGNFDRFDLARKTAVAFMNKHSKG